MGSVAGKSHAYTREAHHAGSWYFNNGKSLDEKLEDFLQKAEQNTTSKQAQRERLRALIVPHAGYSYSGPTAAYAYQILKEELQDPQSPIKRVLVLHPSHHVYLDGCAVSGATQLATPIGHLTVDDELRQHILSLPSSSSFSMMKKRDDEEEHSGEMQYPYLAKILRDTQRTDILVLPVMCGALSNSKESSYGKSLGEIIARPDVCTVVSSDFCHWGSRFSYRPQPEPGNSLPLHEFVEQMDRRGMDLIQLKEPGAFAEYLKETKNTICGRHAIAVWLYAASVSAHASMKVEFVHYAQSSPVRSLHDSSVSYAAAKATM